MTDVLASPWIEPEALHVVVDRWRGRVASSVVLPCACGGPEIVAASRRDADVLAGVRRHQVEPAHAAWRQSAAGDRA